MFIVRKGTLKVYLINQKDGKEVELAKVSIGGMIGEMALFDQKPRSASVSAIDEVEVTHISDQDFAKLMTQIPKWFTALMGTLSGRLRVTNERLEKLQASAAPALLGMKSALRILLIMDLIFNKDAEKNGKEWSLEKEPVMSLLTGHFGEEDSVLETILDTLSGEGVLKLKKNQYNKDAITTPNKGSLTRFVQFLGQYLKNATEPCLPEPALDLLKALRGYSEEQAYDTFTVAVEDLAPMGQRLKLPTINEWGQGVHYLKNLDSDLNLVKTNNGSIGLKTQKKTAKELLAHHLIIANLNKRLYKTP